MLFRSRPCSLRERKVASLNSSDGIPFRDDQGCVLRSNRIFPIDLKAQVHRTAGLAIPKNVRGALGLPSSTDRFRRVCQWEQLLQSRRAFGYQSFYGFALHQRSRARSRHCTFQSINTKTCIDGGWANVLVPCPKSPL